MWAIVSSQDVDMFHNDRAVVSVFLTNKLATINVLDALVKFYKQVDDRVGGGWHLLMPSGVRTDRLNTIMESDDPKIQGINKVYDLQLAEKWARSLGLEDDDFSCLAFLDFQDQRNNVIADLSDFSEKDMLSLVDSVQKVIDREKFGLRDPDSHRRNINVILSGFLNSFKAKRVLLNYGPKILEALSSIK